MFKDADPPISRGDIERLREAGFAVVPMTPTEEMKRVGAPICFQAYDGNWDVALSDAEECWRGMVEVGSL